MNDQADTITQIDNAAWDAIVHRDIAQRTAFIFGVRTTGIYCRPGCPARTPLRKNIVLFVSSHAARAASFRACLRCRPDVSVKDDEALIEQACALLAEAETPYRVEEVAQRCDLSRGNLNALFRRTLGITPKNFQSICRAHAFEAALRRGARVVDAVYEAGYGAVSRAYEDSAPYRGCTPRALRNGGEMTTLRYAIHPCWLGLVLIAANDNGVCLVAINETEEALLADMKQRFTSTVFEEATAGSPYDRWITGILDSIENPKKTVQGEKIPTGKDVPLDIQGTAFQQKVWKALRAIPPGETRSYSAVAAAINKPAATRAVAAACGANKLAVIIPCHRVIGKNGQLTGYRWGAQRKRALLEREGLKCLLAGSDKLA